MSDTEQELRAQITQAQEELTAARLHIAALEARLSQNQLPFALELLRITYEASDFRAAVDASLRLICQYSGWVYGEVWIPNNDGTHLVCDPTHYIESTHSPQLTRFRVASEDCTFVRSEGLIGRVWALNAAEWISDLFQLTEAEFKRQNAGIEAGLHGVVAVPIRTNNDDNEVDAVLCFATNSILDRDEDLIRLIAAAAQQVGTVIRDKQAQEMLKHYAHRLEILHQIDRGIIEATSIQAVVEAALKYIRQLIPCERVILGLVDDATDEWIVFAIAMDGVTELGQGTRVRIPPNWLEGFDAGNARIIEDIRAMQEIQPRYQQLLKEGMVSALHVLLVDQERRIGLLALGAAEPGFFTPEHREIAVEIADQLTIAIRQMHLSAALTQHVNDLKQVQVALQEANETLEQRVAERTAQLREAEAKFSTAFRASPAAISIAALPDGRWIEINDALVKMTGYSREELMGHTSAEFDLVDGVARAKILEAIRIHGAVRDVEIQMHTKSNDLVDVLVSTEYIELNGQACALTIQYDITALKRAEREVRRLNADLQQRQLALEAVNKELEAFSYSISHDLRVPLRTINGFTSILVQDYSDQLSTEARGYLEQVREKTVEMGQLINSLLDFARLSRQPLNKTQVLIGDIARSALDTLKAEQENRTLNIVIGDLPACYADLALLRQVMINLLSNALKYTRQQDAAKIEVGWQHINEQTIYFVKDNGVGFDMQYADKLFGVFQRLHSANEFEGLGIGLAIVERIIHRHGGRVWADSEPDKGATFYFTLEKMPVSDNVIS